MEENEIENENEHRAPRVAIVVLNWNGREDTVECVQSLQRLEYGNREIVVVDNGSTDDSAERIRSAFPEITVIALDRNGGYAAGNNAGIRYALDHGADYVWILNNDTVVDEHALTPLVQKMEENESYGICGSKVVYYDEPDRIQILGGGRYNKWTGVPVNFGQHQPAGTNVDAGQIERDLDFIIGASSFVSRPFLEEVGLLAEEYFLYFEEIDWGIRARGRYRLGFEPCSVVYHKEGASIGATNRRINQKSRMADYYMIKNRLKLTWKFYPWLLPFIYVTNCYSIINRVRRRQWDRIPMILKLFFTFNRNDQY